MKRETWDAKHTTNLVIVLAAIGAVVALSIYADGAHVTEVLAFVAGLLVPGSPLPTMLGAKNR